MRSSQVQTTNLSQDPKASPTLAAAALQWLRALFASLLGVRDRVEDDIAAHYAGCGWNDAIEREIVDDVASMHSRRSHGYHH
jgi:hypothetical protein